MPDPDTTGTGPGILTTLSRTVDELPAPGQITAAPVAPAKGAIDVEAGSPVVVVAQHLWDSPTVRRFIGAIKLAWAAFAGYVLVSVLLAGGPFKLDGPAWIALLKDATYPALLTIAGVYGIALKGKDNNPVTSGGLMKPKGDG